MHFWGYLCISFGFESMLKSNMTSDELKFKGPLDTAHVITNYLHFVN